MMAPNTLRRSRASRTRHARVAIGAAPPAFAPSVLRALALAGLGLKLMQSAGCSTSPQPRGTVPQQFSDDRFADAVLACDEGGNAYAVAAELFDNQTQIFCATSRDHGESWGTEFAYLNRSRGGDRGRPQVVTGAPGEVYALWLDSREGPRDVYFNRSLDAGATWLERDVRLNTNPPGSARPRAAALACDERGRVYALWLDDREGFDALYFSRSEDRGQSWLSSDIRATPLGTGRKGPPHLACSEDGEVYAAWIEARDGPPQVFLNASDSRGDVWMFEDVRLSGGGRVLGLDICALEPRSVVATWTEAGAGRAEVFRSVSADAGRAWDLPRAFASSIRPLFDPSPPRVACDDLGHVYIAWTARTSDGSSRFFLEYSEDSGRSFGQTVLDRPAVLAAPDRSYSPAGAPFSMTADRGGNVYLAWFDAHPGGVGLRFDRVSGYGRLWMRLGESLDQGSHLSAGSRPPAVCADDFGHVYVLWNEGHALHVATSPFYGDSGWRHEHL